MASRTLHAAALALAVALVVGPASAVLLDRIVAMVNDDVISWSDLIRYRDFSLRAGPLRDAGGSEEARKELLNALINDRLLLAEAKRFETENPTPSKVDHGVEEVMRLCGGEATFESRLKALGMSPADVRAQASDDLLVNTFIDQRINFFVFVRPEDIAAYYEDHAGSFPGKTPEETTSQIEEILKRQIAEKRLTDYLDTLRAKAVIRINPEPR